MRTASMVLGIIGGVFGVLAGFLAMFVGGVGTIFDADDAGLVVGLGFSAILLGVLGIVGGALANRSPVAAMIMQGFAGVCGFIAISMFWILAGLLLLVGAVLAFLSTMIGRGAASEPGAIDRPANL